MARPFLRMRATLFSAMLGALIAPAAQAADLDPIQEPAPLEGPIEWGTGWYLRGDIGLQSLTVPAISNDFIGSTMTNTRDLVSGGFGAGYQFNDWIRADVTVDRSVFRTSGTLGQLWCPYSAVGLFEVGTGNPVGVLADPNETCTRFGKASLNRTSVLANGYIDIGHFWGFTPYVGGGVGVTYNQASSSVNYIQNSNGALWAPNLTLPNGQVPQWVSITPGWTPPYFLPFAPTNWNTSQTRKSWQFAWNVMAGVSYDVASNLKIDLGYRYLNAGKYTALPAYGPIFGTVSKDITSHEVRVGFRVTTN